MATSVYLDPAQVPPVLRDGYSGQKFQAILCESVSIPADAGTWDGGSRSVYSAIRLSDGAAVSLTDTHSAPWDATRQSRTLTLERGIVVIRSTMFRGKDLGLTFYLRPEDAAPMLPAPSAELSPVHHLILSYTAHRKSSYNGLDRYGMAEQDSRWSDRTAPFPTRAQWDAAKAELITAGKLNKAGAITPAGRNAARSI